MVISVANPAGKLMAQHRMGGAWLANVSISRNKAYAAALQLPMHELADPTKPSESLWGLQTTDENRLAGRGGETLQDMAVIEAPLNAFDGFAA